VSFSFYFVTISHWVLVLVLVSLTYTVQFSLTKVFVLVIVNENNTSCDTDHKEISHYLTGYIEGKDSSMMEETLNTGHELFMYFATVYSTSRRAVNRILLGQLSALRSLSLIRTVQGAWTAAEVNCEIQDSHDTTLRIRCTANPDTNRQHCPL